MSNEVTTSESNPQTPEEIRRIIKRAEAGDQKALPALRKLLERAEWVDALGGDLARQIEHSLIDAGAGKNLSLKEALLAKTDQMRAELAGQSPMPLERLLAERIVTCWLHLHVMHLRYAQAEDLSIHQADYHHRAITQCQRRYFSAIKALAQVRKLALPALQVNIGRKQVNVAAR